MRNFIVTISIILAFAFLCFPQEVIENPDKPSSEKAGRIVHLEEVLCIQDTGDEYYFRYPSNLKIAPDGSVFVMDWSSGLLARFDTNGKLLRNYFKKGESDD